MDVKKRIQELLDQRGWSMYRLSKEADTPWSTIRNVLKKDTEPMISTVEILCKGFGISLSQFFDVENNAGLSEDQRRLIDMWSALDEKDRNAVLVLLESMSKKG